MNSTSNSNEISGKLPLDNPLDEAINIYLKRLFKFIIVCIAAFVIIVLIALPVIAAEVIIPLAYPPILRISRIITPYVIAIFCIFSVIFVYKKLINKWGKRIPVVLASLGVGTFIYTLLTFFIHLETIIATVTVIFLAILVGLLVFGPKSGPSS